MTRRLGSTALFVGLALLPALAAARAGEPSYVAAWADVLERHTRSVPTTVGTTVDYEALKGPAAPAWKALLEDLAATPPPTTRDERLALWINAYNILAIDKVLSGYPVASIRDLGSFFRPVWGQDAGTVAGRTVTLGEIEHEILRPLGEPRIHAAIVCASTSCPSLLRTPFTSEGLDAQLDAVMRGWLRSPTKGMRVNRSAKRITVSKILDWFDEDFESHGGVVAVIAAYGPEADRDWITRDGKNADLAYFDYDWSLNDWSLNAAGDVR